MRVEERRGWGSVLVVAERGGEKPRGEGGGREKRVKWWGEVR